MLKKELRNYFYYYCISCKCKYANACSAKSADKSNHPHR